MFARLCVICVVFAGCGQALAQAACGRDGYRIIARRGDAVLKLNWEWRQSCAHPDWPVRVTAVDPGSANGMVRAVATAPAAAPLLVHAGDPVRLWMQDAKVRIEMSGIAEQSARNGERVSVRVTQQSEELGLVVQQIAGVVRAAEDVEIEP